MWPLVRAGLSALPPETAHAAALLGLRMAPVFYQAEAIGKPYKVMGLNFLNRVGLAAGFDKNGDYLNALAKLGFGFIEIGTITPKPQSGSPTPRLFRLPHVKGLVNRMGFNNLGVQHAARQLAQQGGNFSGILGCNIGRNKESHGSGAIKHDYLTCLRELYGLANYYTINVSSPNTPKLRELQAPYLLHDLLDALVNLREQLTTSHKERVPLLVKVSPDLEPKDIEAMAQVIIKTGMSGVIATNTTTVRPPRICGLPYGGQPGGVSGGPLRKQADQALRLWREILPDNIAIIGVGGITSGADAKAKFAAKADLIQLYTGLIYQGPRLVPDCAEAAL